MKKEGTVSLKDWTFSDDFHDAFENKLKEICTQAISIGLDGDFRPVGDDPYRELIDVVVKEVADIIDLEFGEMAHLFFGFNEATMSFDWGRETVIFSWDWEAEFLKQFALSDQRSRMAERLREIADTLENTSQ